MAEQLTLMTPETKPTTTTYEVVNIYFDKEAPSIKVTLRANTGERFVWRYVVSATVTDAQVRAALSFINQGKFMTVLGESLQRWLLDSASTQGVKVGTVNGTPD